MSFEPTPSQALLLFGLLARHGECPQAELMPAVKKADREALVTAKLLAAEKVGRGLYLRLEDAGWAWAGDHFDAELPPAQRALSDMMKRVGEHLKKSGNALAEFIGAKPASLAEAEEPKTPAKAKPKTSGKSKTIKKLKAPSATELRKRIEAAYLAITGGRKNENVRLSRLRRELSDLDRPSVDAALARMLKGDKTASLGRDDNTRQLDASDHEAAFNPSGEPFHLLWISS